jgi:hypothetical protein
MKTSEIRSWVWGVGVGLGVGGGGEDKDRQTDSTDFKAVARIWRNFTALIKQKWQGTLRVVTFM